MPGRPEAGGVRALACIYCPAAQRPLFGSLLQIEQEIRASLRAGLDHEIAHMRLAWWHEECARTRAGRPSHPLTREVASHGGDSAAEGLMGLVELAQWDLARATFDTRRELAGYCERWSAAMLGPLTQGTAASSAALRSLGAHLHELELLLALPADAHAGRIRLPLDELAELQMSPGQLAQPPWTPAFAEFLATRHRQLRAALSAGVATIAPEAQPPLRAVIVWTALVAHHSVRAARRLPDAHRAREDRAPLDAARAWRIARRASAGRARLPAQ